MSIDGRLKRIEKKLEPEKGERKKFPCPDGSFIEMPVGLTLVDVLALAGIGRDEVTMDETERK